MVAEDKTGECKECKFPFWDHDGNEMTNKCADSSRNNGQKWCVTEETKNREDTVKSINEGKFGYCGSVQAQKCYSKKNFLHFSLDFLHSTYSGK